MQKHEKFGGRVKDRVGHACGWPDCTDTGEFRAPKSVAEVRAGAWIGASPGDDDGPDNNGVLWFCLDHVRAYNARWDCFAGLDTDGIDKFRRGDSTWHRPTWPFAGRMDAKNSGFDGRPIDPLDIFDNDGVWSAADSAGGTGRNCFSRPLNSEDRQAFSVLGLDRSAAPTDIKACFKALVKELHPDMNGGDRTYEERLSRVIAAYNHLSKAFAT